MRGKHQYAILLVFEHTVMVEGRPRTNGRIYEELFDAIAVEVEYVVWRKEKRGESWVSR
jgi:hypothetical protein